jgi:hypothetical protein
VALADAPARLGAIQTPIADYVRGKLFRRERLDLADLLAAVAAPSLGFGHLSIFATKISRRAAMRAAAKSKNNFKGNAPLG